MFDSAQQMLFDKFDYSGRSIFDRHSQFLSNMDVNGVPGGVEIQVQSPAG
jgi:hypothetical protein